MSDAWWVLVYKSGDPVAIPLPRGSTALSAAEVAPLYGDTWTMVSGPYPSKVAALNWEKEKEDMKTSEDYAAKAVLCFSILLGLAVLVAVFRMEVRAWQQGPPGAQCPPVVDAGSPVGYP